MRHPRVFSARDPRAPKGALYVGRGRDPRTGVRVKLPVDLGNPFRFEDHGAEAMRLFLDHLGGGHFGRAIVAYVVRELPGVDLLCWCAPRPCHAEVYARLADGEPLEAIRADMLRAVGLEEARS